jgi:hypothetical protein
VTVEGAARDGGRHAPHCPCKTVERPELPALGEGLGARSVAWFPGGGRLPPLARVFVALVVLALLLLAALATQPWGFILLGSAIGLLVVAGVPAARTGLMPLVALGRAALPLLLPLFVFVAAGVVKSPPHLQFAVGLTTLLVAWFWLIKPDWEAVSEMLKRRRRWRSRLRGIAQVGIPALLVLGALGFLVTSLGEAFRASDETTSRFFILATGFLAAAAVFRLVGYARTAFRAAVALAILALLARLGMEIGALKDILGLEAVEPSTLALIAGVLLAVTCAVEIMTSLLARDAKNQRGLTSDQLSPEMRTAVFLETPVAARWVTDRAGVTGLGLSLLSALLLLCGVFAASTAGGASEDLDETAKAAQPATAPSGLGDAALAATFSPVLLFTEDQRWTPIAVDAYTQGATVTDWEQRRIQVNGVDELDTTCPGVVKSPCYVMVQECAKDTDDATCAEELPDDKAVYVRVARIEDWSDCVRGKPCADGSPNPFAAAKGRYARDTTILLQYWYFYPFNEWVAPTAIGELKQIHPADWEAVTIGLSDERPLWVAYSAHCAGSFADWGKIRVAASDPKRPRPLVAVAHGSQANYRAAEESRVPNFAECSGIPEDRLSLASYAANIRDRTDDAITWEPTADQLRLVDAETPPMSFPGRWARYNRMTLENLGEAHPLGTETQGPQSPPLQALWQSPMRTIFGGGAWKED